MESDPLSDQMVVSILKQAIGFDLGVVSNFAYSCHLPNQSEEKNFPEFCGML